MAVHLDGADDGQVAACLTCATLHEPSAAGYGVGSVLSGKYRLDAPLGGGAMGAVWQATHLVLNCSVAIKLTHAELAGETFRDRLQLEARAAAVLGHPAVVRIFDVGETEAGDPFIVMELLQGATLAEMLAGGRLPAVRAVQILLPIVDALAAMHSRGVVHRDLKPDNLLVSLDDQRVQPKILDFGIAKLNDAGCESRLDDPGTLIGSPEYMSPEQAAACPDVDFRTDIWSICVVLYEALSGETPFQATNQLVLLHAIIADEPASLVRRGVADETLWSIVRSGLSKDRTERPASMHELGRALARWLLDHGVREDVCGTSLESKWLARDDTSIAVARSEVHMPAAGPRRATDLVQTTRPVRARSSKRTRANTRDATRTTKGRSPRVFAALLAVFTTVALAALQRHGFDPAMVASRIETSSRSAWARLQSESVRRDFPAFRSVLPRSWRGGVGR